MSSRHLRKAKKASSAAELLDVHTDRMVRLLPAGMDWCMGSWTAAEKGGICDDPMEINSGMQITAGHQTA